MPSQPPLGTRPGFGTQPRYEVTFGSNQESKRHSTVAQSWPWGSQVAVKKIPRLWLVKSLVIVCSACALRKITIFTHQH